MSSSTSTASFPPLDPVRRRYDHNGPIGPSIHFRPASHPALAVP
jgi:hypothetical protein